MSVRTSEPRAAVTPSAPTPWAATDVTVSPGTSSNAMAGGAGVSYTIIA